MPSRPTTISSDRSVLIPTRSSNPTPSPRRWCASRFARPFSSPYVSSSSPCRTANASGACRTRSSNSSCTHRSRRYPTSVRSHPSSPSSTSDTRRHGSSTSANSTRFQCSSSRSTVPRSYSSSAYVSHPLPDSSAYSSRSNLVVLVSTPNPLTSSPARDRPAPEPLWTWNTACTSGFRLRSRSGCSSSTSCSNGRSWCSYAPSAPSRTRPSTSPRLGFPPSSVRIASVFTKNPTSPSTSRIVRFAIGDPTTTSSLPLHLDSTTCHPLSSVMYSVVPRSRPTPRSPLISSSPSSNRTDLPRKLATAGRTRSSPTSSTRGAPLRRSTQYPRCRSSPPPSSHPPRPPPPPTPRTPPPPRPP